MRFHCIQIQYTQGTIHTHNCSTVCMGLMYMYACTFVLFPRILLL